MSNKVYLVHEDCRNTDFEGHGSFSNVVLVYSTRKQAQENMERYVENQEQFMAGAKIVDRNIDFYTIETDFNGAGPLFRYSYYITEKSIDIPYK